jgi:hypothetical protein
MSCWPVNSSITKSNEENSLKQLEKARTFASGPPDGIFQNGSKMEKSLDRNEKSPGDVNRK